MEIKKTRIAGCYTITPAVYADERGHFFESFNQQRFEDRIGQSTHFVQDNQSFSTKGVLRGLHFQKGKFAQAKLVRVLQGEVLDVAVDLRSESPTYGNVFSTTLSHENHTQLFIPRGCAHGFITLSETAVFAYKCDNYYEKDAEGGLLYNDPFFSIDWQIPEDELIISEKDKILPTFKELMQKPILKF
ncbi:dTDP-4-dehydrorhamnose 3,5-epimerase [Spongiimicrobium salis]|uniref:dTDP-4-dehydrorhamnose 3,5-epimerase n=1 Tax=Spongiimicrobium salis TaxID=1667022 RepID=UPI00374D266C